MKSNFLFESSLYKRLEIKQNKLHANHSAACKRSQEVLDPMKNFLVVPVAYSGRHC